MVDARHLVRSRRVRLRELGSDPSVLRSHPCRRLRLPLEHASVRSSLRISPSLSYARHLCSSLTQSVLLTVLVAILSKTFADISADAAAESMFRKAVSTIEGVKSDAVSSYQAPFNIVAVVFMFPMKVRSSSLLLVRCPLRAQAKTDSLSPSSPLCSISSRLDGSTRSTSPSSGFQLFPSCFLSRSTSGKSSKGSFTVHSFARQ